ncbi:hypothetical protein EON77_20985, partial [bacterium]
LWRVRNRLHAHAGRKSDRLTFDEQEAIALEMQAADARGDAKATPARAEAPGGPDPRDSRASAAERLMQDYYLHARVVSRARERLLERAIPPKRRQKPVEVDVGGGVRLFDGQVTIASTQALASDPALALRVYATCVQKNAPVLAFAREAIARAASDAAWCEALRASLITSSTGKPIAIPIAWRRCLRLRVDLVLISKTPILANEERRVGHSTDHQIT